MIKEQHPSYVRSVEDWQKMQHAYAGERVVKEHGTLYLPATPGQLIDGIATGQRGYENYCSYRTRARYPDFVSQAVEALLGVMHRKPAVIDLPARLEPLRERATVQGESLLMLLRRINEQQLVMGRVGIMADVPSDALADVMPYVAMYSATDIINWDDGRRNAVQKLALVIANESEYIRKNFNWELDEKYRILVLDPETGTYKTGLLLPNSGSMPDLSTLAEPSIAGVTLDHLPFVIINSKDIVPEPDNPPLLGLAELALAVYRGEADYRTALFMQGQDTLIVVGATGDGELRVGAGARIDVPVGGDAKYIGVSSAGLSEMRQSIENDKQAAAEIGGQMLSTTSRAAEAAETLRIRVAARTASLNQIALAGAAGLETLLKIMAGWVKANPDEVSVTPNQDFADDQLEGATIVDFMTAKGLGAPISARTIHEMLEKKDITQMSYEEELEQIEEEEASTPGSSSAEEEEAAAAAAAAAATAAAAAGDAAGDAGNE